MSGRWQKSANLAGLYRNSPATANNVIVSTASAIATPTGISTALKQFSLPVGLNNLLV